jgi:hypothetical protein
MGRAQPVTLGNLHFKRKGDAIAYLNAILKTYDVGDRVGEQDATVLRIALAMHPDAQERIGAGIKDFSVRSADFGTKCFWVNRVDGTTAKFSHRKCF